MISVPEMRIWSILLIYPELKWCTCIHLRSCLFLVPYRWNRGDFRFPLRLSLCLSVRLSVCQSTWCPSTRFSELFWVVLWDIDLKFGVWICLGIVQIKFEFRLAWCTFTGVIAVCWNLVFRLFLCFLFRYWLDDFCLDIIQNKFEFRHARPTFMGVIALC